MICFAMISPVHFEQGGKDARAWGRPWSNKNQRSPRKDRRGAKHLQTQLFAVSEDIISSEVNGEYSPQFRSCKERPPTPFPEIENFESENFHSPPESEEELEVRPPEQERFSFLGPISTGQMGTEPQIENSPSTLEERLLGLIRDLSSRLDNALSRIRDLETRKPSEPRPVTECS